MHSFYIYIYLDQYNIPFYVGKGKQYRYLLCTHVNNNKLLKNKINKIGSQNVKITLLHQNLSEEQAFLYEKVWIELIGRRDLHQGPLCNMTDGGDGQSGLIFSVETRAKISQANKGRKLSEEHKQKIRQANKKENLSIETLAKMSKASKGRQSGMKGKHHSEEAKKRISDASRNRIVSIDTRQKIGQKHKGKIVSIESRQKMSNAKKGQHITEETKEKIRKALTGHKRTKEEILKLINRKASEETKKKMSIARKKWHQNKKIILQKGEI